MSSVPRPSQPRAAETPSQHRPGRKPARDCRCQPVSWGGVSGQRSDTAAPRLGSSPAVRRQPVHPTRPASGSPWKGPPWAPLPPEPDSRCVYHPHSPKRGRTADEPPAAATLLSSLVLGTACLSLQSPSSLLPVTREGRLVFVLPTSVSGRRVAGALTTRSWLRAAPGSV